jgi:hypothetical protein
LELAVGGHRRSAPCMRRLPAARHLQLSPSLMTRDRMEKQIAAPNTPDIVREPFNSLCQFSRIRFDREDPTRAAIAQSSRVFLLLLRSAVPLGLCSKPHQRTLSMGLSHSAVTCEGLCRPQRHMHVPTNTSSSQHRAVPVIIGLITAFERHMTRAMSPQAD